MNLNTSFGAQELCQPLLAEIDRLAARSAPTGPIRLMEVCGTHTVAIFRHGIRSLLPPQVQLLSGPGCPVCVTPAGHIDLCVQAAKQDDVVVATFGDLLRVPGSHGSLADARARGEAQVEMVYSPMDALALARRRPELQVVFPAIGFETTAPAIAATVLAAQAAAVENFSIIPLAKTMPAVLVELLKDRDLNLSGLLCPGHVSAITGTAMYEALVQEYGLCCAVTGFEPADLLAGILSLLQQQATGQPQVANCYPRVVDEAGNPRARNLLERVFEPVDSKWRGLGSIPASGLGLRPAYRHFNAVHRLGLEARILPEPPGCRCGQILKGRLQPPDCPLYGRACTPLAPVGPCMVSSEGSCAAWYRYSGHTI